MRTDQLLQQLQGSNVELDKRRRELEDRAMQLESRNREIAHASASLEAKSQELVKVSQYKSRFLTNMSHEIRTPLNSMMILAQLLAANEDKHLTQQQQEWASTIHSAGKDLLALINQILDLSKVEAGRVEPRPESASMMDLQEFVERTFRPAAMQRGVDFVVDVADGLPSHITTDRQLLEQILKNLLANAFKFTERGRVELRIEPAPSARAFITPALQGAVVVAFSVIDSGIGIPSDQLERIFDAFQQADASITRTYGGTGLGLTISREYARLLGGEITVRSTPGAGSTFTLYLPMLEERQPRTTTATATATTTTTTTLPARAAPAPALPVDLEAIAGKTVLVVDDDPRNLYALTSLLEGLRVSVLSATSARDAFGRLREHPDLDLVLMDIMMPEIDGLQATRDIRAMKEFATLPIVALTAKASAADRAECIAAGFNDYLAKPADVSELVVVIAHNLRTPPKETAHGRDRPGEADPDQHPGGG
jgi:signal transduction histidine kinase/ActR/RegA family two-component response regulator